MKANNEQSLNQSSHQTIVGFTPTLELEDYSLIDIANNKEYEKKGKSKWKDEELPVSSITNEGKQDSFRLDLPKP